MIFDIKSSESSLEIAYRAVDTGRGKCRFGWAIPARRLDCGLGRERVYLSMHISIGLDAVGEETYLANARDSAFLALTFWLPMNDSTVTAIARSMSCAEQYSDKRILQKASPIRMMASR